MGGFDCKTSKEKRFYREGIFRVETLTSPEQWVEGNYLLIKKKLYTITHPS